MGIVSGLIFYQEYKDIDDYHIGIFALGVTVSIVGLGVLAFRKSKTPQIESPLARRAEVASNHSHNKSGSRLSFSFNKPAALTGSFNFADGYDKDLGESLPLLSSPPAFPRTGTATSPSKVKTSPIRDNNSGDDGGGSQLPAPTATDTSPTEDDTSTQNDHPDVKISIN